MAVSVASEPELVRNECRRSPGAEAASRSANSTAPRVVKKIGPAVATWRACSAMADGMSERPCPRGVCHIDEQRSK